MRHSDRVLLAGNVSTGESCNRDSGGEGVTVMTGDRASLPSRGAGIARIARMSPSLNRGQADDEHCDKNFHDLSSFFLYTHREYISNNY